MRVFVTGASGWIGSAVVPELQDAGHEVVGLARSDESAAALAAVGVTPLRGGLDDLDSLREGAAASDAVVHLAFNHDFSDYLGAGRTERAAMETFLGVLEGSDRPLLFASGVAMVQPGEVATELVASSFSGPDSPRGGAEALALSYADRGVLPIALRFAPTVHGEGDHGFTSAIAQVAKQSGVSAYVGDGSSRWPAVHRLDAGSMVRLALENASTGSIAHAVAEEGISAKAIAEAIGAQLDLPVVSIAAEESLEHFGWIGRFFGLDIPASSALTRQRLGWTPTHQGLLADIAAGYYTR